MRVSVHIHECTLKHLYTVQYITKLVVFVLDHFKNLRSNFFVHLSHCSKLLCIVLYVQHSYIGMHTFAKTANRTACTKYIAPKAPIPLKNPSLSHSPPPPAQNVTNYSWEGPLLSAWHYCTIWGHYRKEKTRT